MTKINVNSTAKIQDFINQVQELARVRRIDAADVQEAAEQAEAYLDQLMSKKNRSGVAIEAINLHAQDFPCSYNGIPEATYFSLVRGAQGWFLTAAWRQACRQTSQATVVLESRHEEAIVHKAKQHFQF